MWRKRGWYWLSWTLLLAAIAVVTAQSDPKTDDVAIYRAVLRHPEASGRGPGLAAIVLQRETTGPALSESQMQTLRAPQEIIESLIEGAKRTGELPSELRQESGVTILNQHQMESCLATVEELRERATRDPRPRMFLSRIAYSTDRQTAAVAMASCGGGRIVRLNRTTNTWSIVGALAVWDH